MHLVTREGKSPVGCIRGGRGYKRRYGAMRVIAPGEKRRQVASGVYTRREDVLREVKGQ